MGNEVTGVIQEIQTKQVAGGKTAFNVVVGGQAFGAGLYAPKCKVGDYVKFSVDESRGYKNIERNTLKVSTNKPPAEAVAEAASTSVAAAFAGIGSFDKRQDAISRQAASNTAISFMVLLQAAGALPVPAAKGAAQKALEAVLHGYEQSFYERNTGNRWVDITPASTSRTMVAPATEVLPATESDEWK
jgi:hypothetical protein